MRGRHEDAARRIDLQAEHGRRVEVGEEDQRVVLAVIAVEVFDQRRTPRSLLLEPRHLVVARVRIVEDPVGILVERGDVARVRVLESPHRDAADAVVPLGILVLPRNVVARARRQHLDVVLGGEPLGDQPAVILRPAENLGAVALNDEGNLHAVSLSSSLRMRSSPKSASLVALAGNDLPPQAVVVGELSKKLGRVFEIFRRELHARAAKRIRHRR